MTELKRKQNMKTKAFIYIIIAGLLWGTSGIFVHYLAPYGLTSLQMTAVRGTVSFICIAAYLLICNRGKFKTKPKELLIFGVIGMMLFSTAYLYYSAMQMTSISTAVILMYAAPIYVMVFSVIFLGESFSKLKLASLVLMIVGCCLVSGIIGGLKFNLVGILLGFFSGLTYATYNIVTKVSMDRGNSPLTNTVYGFAFMAVIALSISKPAGIITVASTKPSIVVPLMIGLGVVTFVTPYFLYTLAMKELPAGTASALGIVEPMAATVYSVILFSEELTVFSAVGIILILLAVVLLGRAEGNHENRSNT